MEFKKPIIDIIKQRTSTRTYDGSALEQKDFEILSAYLEEINKEIKIKARFIIVSNLGTKNEGSKKLGTYGFIAGATSYIIGIMDNDEKDCLEFGYVFERIVLFATSLSVGTCWLGGTFNRRNFEGISNLKENEFIPILSPVGYKKEQQRVFETTLRASISADNKKPWSELFFDKNLKPLSENDAGKYSIPLEMVRLGPSASNKQPWRIVKDDNMFYFFLFRTKGYGLASYDMQKNDMGIAKCHFDLSRQELGLKGSWVELKDIDVPNEMEYLFSWVGREV